MLLNVIGQHKSLKSQMFKQKIGYQAGKTVKSLALKLGTLKGKIFGNKSSNLSPTVKMFWKFGKDIYRLFRTKVLQNKRQNQTEQRAIV